MFQHVSVELTFNLYALACVRLLSRSLRLQSAACRQPYTSKFNIITRRIVYFVECIVDASIKLSMTSLN